MIRGVFRYINFTCSLLIPLFFFDFLHGLQFGNDKTTVAFIGSNVTLTWNLILTAEEKKEDLEVWFGTWNKNYHFVESFLKKITLESNGTMHDQTVNSTLAWRWFWTGDISRDYTVAFQLTNVQPSDAGDYGIRVRVDLHPPSFESQGPFSLVVEDPPVKPTADDNSRNIRIEVVEGDNVNITCRLVFDRTPVVIWLKDDIPVQKVRDVVLVIESVNRSQSGNYACFSVSHDENKTSAITAVNVLYAPSILASPKVVSLTVNKGTKKRLRCEADGSPTPQFVWYKNSDIISSGFISSGNSSILTLHHAGEEEFARFVCTARNRIGWDALTFNVYRETGLQEQRPATRAIEWYYIVGPLSGVVLSALIVWYLCKRRMTGTHLSS
ncbi:limbic system-associated membrane protein-like [Montipora foliosa]|uniref:limbic system-associated membrane protein-like n=1 Tax=Montipora foliosa TaxID=591990 RepID=UPI0035F10B98